MRASLVLRGTWDSVCQRALEYAQESYSKYGIRLTLRALFYYLSDAEGLIRHTQIAYKKLSEKFARYRERHGQIDVLQDTTRSIRKFCILETIEPREWLKWSIRRTLLLFDGIWRLPRWYGQKYYVIIFIEKETITLIEEIARDYEVDAFPTRGFSSVTKMWEVATSLRDINENYNKNIVVLSLTDFDPSGVFIERDYRRKLVRYGAINYEIERVCMKPEHIREYDLPAIPHDDPKAERIKKDPRYPVWLKLCEEMGVRSEVVELDAFAGLRPREFRELIVSHINKYFDNELERKRKEEEERRKKEVEKLKEEFQNRLKDLLD